MSFRSIREWAGRNPRTVAAIATASTAVTWFTSQHAEQISNNVAEETYNAIRHIPTAAEITRHARQNLVGRLDDYQREHPATFANVVSVIDAHFLPAIRRHALVGEARVTITAPALVAHFEDSKAMCMAVDVMFDRGFGLRVEERPGPQFRFKITFEPPRLHNVAAEGQGNVR